MAPTKSAAKPVAKKASAHPTFLAMIQECVKAHPEEARAGVSRPTIKKFLAEKYKIDMSSASNTNNLANAIKRGADTGALSLPKGIGGKVKLASKAKTADKENVAPKKAAPTKAAPAKAPAKAAPAAKKPVKAPAKKAAPKPAAKKAAAKPAAKKTSTAKKPVAAKAAAKPAAKKAAPKKAAPKKKTA